MFVAREHELQVLEKLFTSDSFEMWCCTVDGV